MFRLAICLGLCWCLMVSVHGQSPNEAVTPKKVLPSFPNTTLTDTAAKGITLLIPLQSKILVPKNILSSKYYLDNLGFFCKKELQIQKAVKLPVFFRLGSVNYTDKMEGKSNPATH